MFTLLSFSASKYNTDNFPNCDANKNQSLPLEDLLHQSVKKGEKAEQINSPSRFHGEKKKNKSDALMSGKAKPCTTLNQERALVSRPPEIECIKRVSGRADPCPPKLVLSIDDNRTEGGPM